MNQMLTVLLLSICVFCHAQDTREITKEALGLQKQQINNLIVQIDGNKTLNKKTFSKRTKGVQTDYTYTTDKTALVKLRCHWLERTKNSERESTREFYMDKGKLIFANELNIYVYNQKDTIGDGCSYFFKDEKLIDLSSLGHGKYESDDWEPEQEVLFHYRHIRKLVIAYDKSKK